MKPLPFILFLLTLCLQGVCSPHLEAAPPKKAVFAVGGNCGMCKRRIEKAASGLEGVVEAVWSKESKKLTLKYEPGKIGVDEVKKAIAAVGHDAGGVKAPQEVYDKLHECCLYDRLK